MSPPKVASCIQVLIIRILNQCRHQDHHHNRHCQHHDTSDHHLLSVLLFILVDSSRRVRVSQRDARRVKTALLIHSLLLLQLQILTLKHPSQSRRLLEFSLFWMKLSTCQGRHLKPHHFLLLRRPPPHIKAMEFAIKKFQNLHLDEEQPSPQTAEPLQL